MPTDDWFSVGRDVKVNNKMTKNYSFKLSEPIGKNFSDDFKPEMTPRQMLEAGVFEGKYFNDCLEEYPSSWSDDAKAKGKLCSIADPSVNAFEIKSRLSLQEWRKNGWIPVADGDPDVRGWAEWYFRYYLGRRIPEIDKIQIGRWKSFARHLGQIIASIERMKPGDRPHTRAQIKKHRPRQRQALLQWAYNPYIVSRSGGMESVVMSDGKMVYKHSNITDPYLASSAIRELSALNTLKGIYGIEELIDTKISPDDLELVFIQRWGSLANAMTKKEPINIKKVLYTVLRCIAEALSRGVLHLDVKPGNILVGSDEYVSLCDWGCARLWVCDSAPICIQIPRYRDPCLPISSKYTINTDIWSVGMVMFELYAGLDLSERLFPAKDSLEQDVLNNIFKAFLKESDDLVGKKLVGIDVPDKRFKPLSEIIPECRDNNALDLLSKMLCFNANNRITAREALNHKYFTGMPAPVMRGLLPAPKCPVNKSKDRRRLITLIGREVRYTEEFFLAVFYLDFVAAKLGMSDITMYTCLSLADKICSSGNLKFPTLITREIEILKLLKNNALVVTTYHVASRAKPSKYFDAIVDVLYMLECYPEIRLYSSEYIYDVTSTVVIKDPYMKSENRVEKVLNVMKASAKKAK